MTDSKHRPSKADSIDTVRRKLLKLTVYVPPAIIGTMLVSREGWAQASCNPASCNPATGCNPGPTCGPATCKPRS